MPSMAYSRTGELIEIIIRDNTGRKLESHSIPVFDKAMYQRIITYIENKYGLRPSIEPSFASQNNKFV
jgi:hypothetical protein